MSGQLPHAERLAVVDEAFRSLPERYLGADPEFDATYHVRLCDLGHTWEIRCTSHGARVRKGVTRRTPDVTLSTDADTWLRLRQGEFSGVQAFQRRLLEVRGNLDYAVGFEGMFRLPNGRPPLLQIYDVPVGRHQISTLTMGSGPDVLLLHGLGGTRASLFETAAALSQHYRVHAPDLPGFGSSSKPARGAYNARWYAENILGLMDQLDIGRAHLVGNSMGGPRRDRGRIDRTGAGRRAGPAVSGRCLAAPWLSPDRPAPAPGVRYAAPRLPPLHRRVAVLEHVRRPRRDRPGGRRPDGRRVPPDLPLRRRALCVPRLGPQHLPRGAVRPRRLLSTPGASCSRRRCSSGVPTTRWSPRRSAAT